MNKQQFLAAIRDRLGELSPEDLESSLDYYREMIEDRMEDGMTEEEAVAAMGSADEIAAQVLAETPRPEPTFEPEPMPEADPEPPKSRLRKGWAVALAVVGSPVWLPLLIAAVVILAAVYIVIWSVLISMYAVDLSLAAGALGSAFGFGTLLFFGYPTQGMLFLGAGLLCAGLAVLLFFACNWLARLTIRLGKVTAHGIKAIFIRKGGAK